MHLNFKKLSDPQTAFYSKMLKYYTERDMQMGIRFDMGFKLYCF